MQSCNLSYLKSDRQAPGAQETPGLDQIATSYPVLALFSVPVIILEPAGQLGRSRTQGRPYDRKVTDVCELLSAMVSSIREHRHNAAGLASGSTVNSRQF
jgi:hypothetical protein